MKLSRPPAAAATLREVHALLGRLAGEVDEGPCSSLVPELERAGRRLTALRLQVLTAGETTRVAADGGFADTGAWLARQTRTTGRDAAGQVRLATDLQTRTATREALGEGRLSEQHARVITGALRELPDRLTDAEVATVETDLVRDAARLNPGELRRRARRALAAVEPDPAVVDSHEDGVLTREEDSAYARASLTLHDHADGTTSGHFTVPTLAGDVLRKVIDAMTAPRRSSRGRSDALPVTDQTDWAHRRGAALVELLEHLPTDHLTPKTAATVVVQLRHDVLRGALAAAGLDTDQAISAGAARRLACTSGIIPTVLGGASLPLDLGREQRLYTEAQRVALGTRHTRCAAAGCTRPFAWCEIHHRDPWSKGGRTDLAGAVPLCGHHHRLVHHPGYLHHDDPDGLTFTRVGAATARRRPSGPPVRAGAAPAPTVPRPRSAPRPAVLATMRT